MIRIVISDEKKERLASIFSDAGQVLFASVVINPILNSQSNSESILVGSATTLIVWVASLLLSK